MNLKRLQEQGRRAEITANEALARLARQLPTSQVVSRSVFRALANVSSSVNVWHRRVAPSVDSIIKTALDKTTDALSFYPVLVAERVHLFWRGGWIEAAHVDLDLGQLQTMLAQLRGESTSAVREALDELLPAYFRDEDHKKLREMVEGWGSTSPFTDRDKIFSEALEAHTLGRYTTSVHLLVPHVEGLLRDLTGVTSTTGHTWLNKINRSFGFKPEKGGRWLSDPARAVEEFRAFDKYRRFSEMRRLDTEATLMGLNGLYEKGGIKDSFRNRVTHGSVLECSETDSIRTFCILDQLHRVTNRYRNF